MIRKTDKQKEGEKGNKERKKREEKEVVSKKKKVRMVGDWRYYEDHVCKFKCRCLNTVFFIFP
jgi:hypothetical protein